MSHFIEPIPIRDQQWNENVIPKVSIQCITYNHDKFIRDTIEGFLMQKTTFPVEILIHDDASTDNTATIIKEYELEYPGLIKPIYQIENQYSKKNGIITKIQNKRTRGEYIAKCEGDDYWTDPYKLLKQVEFMDNHLEYNVCFHQFYRLEHGEYKILNKAIIESFKEKSTYENGFEFTLSDLFEKWFVGTLTIMFRASVINYDLLNKFSRFFDLHLFYYCLKDKNGFFLFDNMAVYRRHGDGVWSGASQKKRLNTDIISYRELYKVSPNTYTKYLYKRSKKNRLKYYFNCIKKNGK